MRKIAFILLSFLFSVSCYCKKVYRSFYTQRLPRVVVTIFKMEKRGSLLGIIIGQDWYPISKEKDLQGPSAEIWYAYYSTDSDTINVYKPGLADDQYSYTLILTPSQKETFTKNTNNLHFSQSHWSHSSHYSSAK